MDDTTDTSDSFDLDQIGQSTPMNSSFLSPMKKLDNLNLNNLSDIHEDLGDDAPVTSNILEEQQEPVEIEEEDNDVEVDVDVDDDDDDDIIEEDEDDDYDIGDKTIEHSTDEEDLVDIKPVFLNKRKRETSDIDMITPTSNSSSNYQTSKMSICSNVTSSSLTNFKISFSNSDSTPCPPMKKKFRLETPSTRKLLDLSNSKKTNVSELPEFNYADNANITPEHNYHDHSGSSSPIEIIKNQQQSTPISQSTPSNSRAPSPVKESEGMINGYRLINREVNSNQRRQNYQDQEEVDDDEQEDEAEEREEIGDQRINDPYLNAPEPINQDNIHIRTTYMSNKYLLPLLEIYDTYDKLTILQKLNDNNILEFYKFIKLPQEKLIDLMKRERIKWHPDKWVNESFDMDYVSTISKTINSIIENIEL